ncbi:DUF4261 domain-containing protein [Aliiroseovarius sp. YM-037]|uniref:DUF4261 domain-containing protein n=1 Tax=Aliiroseovarius sp. YM-037 TaxID=3341728 RepID=UPI003A7FF0A0
MTTDGKDQDLNFSVDILFSEPLQFELDEIVAAVNEDFPTCQIKDVGINPSNSLKTDNPILAALEPVEAHDGQMIQMIGIGFPDEEFRNADHTETIWRSGGFGKEALAKHQSYLNVSVKAVNGSLAARFRAARLLNAVTAVFAQLPITLGIYIKWGAHLVSPDHWQNAAEQAMTGDWPLTTWLSYRAGWDAGPDRSSQFAVGYTTGLKQFLPYELQIEAAPIKPTDVIQMLAAAAWMPLQGGSVYEDGNTVGVEEGVRYVLRQPRNPDDSPGDVFVLLHPDSPVDEVAKFGKRPSKARYHQA